MKTSWRCVRCGVIASFEELPLDCALGACPMEPVITEKGFDVISFALGFISAAVVAGLIYVVTLSGLADFLRGKW